MKSVELLFENILQAPWDFKLSNKSSKNLWNFPLKICLQEAMGYILEGPFQNTHGILLENFQISMEFYILEQLFLKGNVYHTLPITHNIHIF